MNCIIIEDQPPAQRILKKYITDMGTLQLKGTFSDAVKAIEYIKQEEIGLIFLDIHLPKISGIEFLKSLTSPPYVIFTTAFPDYALQGYELNVVDYLLKPFSFERFVSAVSKVLDRERKEKTMAEGSPIPATQKELFIKTGHSYEKIVIDEIFYIRSDMDYTEIIVENKKYLTSETLRHWSEKLDSEQFYRVHKSYIVNIAKVKRIMGNQVYFSKEVSVPIGRTYKDDFMNKYVK